MFEWLKETSENLKDFIITHGDNALLWIGIFFGGILVFVLTYKALHKND